MGLGTRRELHVESAMFTARTETAYRSRGALALVLACVLITVLALAAESVAAPDVEGVAATVNGENVSIQEVDSFIAGREDAKNPANKVSRDEALARIIDQRVLTQQAIAEDPEAVVGMNAAERSTRGQAYLNFVMARAAKPKPQEIDAFYSEHPELFAARRVYRFKEIAIEAPAQFHDALKAELDRLDQQPDKDAIMPELEGWLRDQGLRFRSNVARQGAEQLPMQLLPQVHTMKDGDLLLIPRVGTFVVSLLETSHTEPWDEQKATPLIEQYLLNLRRQQLAADEVKRLRDAATIRYFAPFAPLARTQ
jgi:EpsD family peptidyl-prolyl cis-trans isomerase